MGTPGTRTPRDHVDRFLTLLRRMGRYWVQAALVIVLGGSVSLLLAYSRKRVYRSETIILYREAIRSSTIGAGDVDPARKLGLRLRELVLSRPRLQKIIEEHRLYTLIVEESGFVDAVDEMRRHINFRVRDGDTFALSFDGDSPAEVQAVTSLLADALIEENARHRAEEAQGTKTFLDAQRKQGEEELKKRENAFATFIAQHPEFATETGVGATLRAAEKKGPPVPKTTDPTLLALEREASRLRERLAQPTQKKAPESDPRLVAQFNEAEAELGAAQKDLSDKLRQYTEAHPDVRAAKTRVAGAEVRAKRAHEALIESNNLKNPAFLAAEVDRSALQTQLERIQQQIAAYHARQRKNEGENGGEPAPPAHGEGASWIVALETDFERLKRELDEARKRNEELQTRTATAAMAVSAESSGRSQMVVVDPAYQPTHPVKAQRPLFAGLGLLVSLGLAAAAAFGLALVDDRLYDRLDVERLGVAPLLVAVPRGRSSRKAHHG
jgi:hypothetical protein